LAALAVVVIVTAEVPLPPAASVVAAAFTMTAEVAGLMLEVKLTVPA
jgi:hypothetical protein